MKRKRKSLSLGLQLCLFFVVIFNSFDFISAKGVNLINIFDTFALTMAMTALGMETSFDKFKGVGFKPIILATYSIYLVSFRRFLYS